MEMKENKIKITKAKPWAIYFNYEDKKFLLHESSDGYESSTTLYERIQKNGKYELETIASYYGGIITLDYLNTKRGRTYKQVNMKKFLRKLVYHGLVQNKKINEEIEKMKLEVEKYKKIEMFCRNKRLELEYELFR
ncbi:MAG: hypothetical protein V8R81_08750 [Clostridia bacterium]|jgi:hypothetical protein